MSESMWRRFAVYRLHVRSASLTDGGSITQDPRPLKVFEERGSGGRSLLGAAEDWATKYVEKHPGQCVAVHEQWYQWNNSKRAYVQIDQDMDVFVAGYDAEDVNAEVTR